MRFPAVAFRSRIAGVLLAAAVSAQVQAQKIVAVNAGRGSAPFAQATGAQLRAIQNALAAPSAAVLLQTVPSLGGFQRLNPKDPEDLMVAGALAQHLPPKNVTAKDVASALETARPAVDRWVEAQTATLVARVSGGGVSLAALQIAKARVDKFSVYGGDVISRSRMKVADLAAAETVAHAQEIAQAFRGARADDSDAGGFPVDGLPAAQTSRPSYDGELILAREALTGLRATQAAVPLANLGKVEQLAKASRLEGIQRFIIRGLVGDHSLAEGGHGSLEYALAVLPVVERVGLASRYDNVREAAIRDLLKDFPAKEARLSYAALSTVEHLALGSGARVRRLAGALLQEKMRDPACAPYFQEFQASIARLDEAVGGQKHVPALAPARKTLMGRSVSSVAALMARALRALKALGR